MNCLRLARITAPGMTLVLLLCSCAGDDPTPNDGQQVHAVNLDTGETGVFDSDAVPVGWGICSDDDCSFLPPEFPCTRLGPGACLLNQVCGLRLRCDIEIADPIRSVEPPPATTNPPMGGPETTSAAFPVGCELVCLPAKKVTCEQLHVPDACDSRTDCEWQRYCITASPECAAGQDCDETTVCHQVCQPKEPAPCEDLDRRSCEANPTCSWQPGVCPLLCTYPDCDGPVCEPFCQPRVDEPTCPPVATPMCSPNSGVVRDVDERGCVSYRCESIEPQTCKPTGCSGQLCAAEDLVSTCEWREYYQCYKLATCEAQAGQCGWTPNPEFEECMKQHGGPTDPICPRTCDAWCTGQAPAGCDNPGCRCMEPPPDGCEFEYVRQCPDGQVDGCTLGTTKVHQCVPAPLACMHHILLPCPTGQIDGCLSGATKVHQCVSRIEPTCRRGGCSSELCIGPNDPAYSDCRWRDSYKCYELATCAPQASGSCGWTPNEEFDTCMKKLDGTAKDTTQL